jgi:hypothetical protein
MMASQFAFGHSKFEEPVVCVMSRLKKNRVLLYELRHTRLRSGVSPIDAEALDPKEKQSI